MSVLSHNLKEKGFLTLRQHLDQAECAEAWRWLEDCVKLHDTGKGSRQFQA